MQAPFSNYWLPRFVAIITTTWATFVLCFLWILLDAPHIEQLRGKEKLSTALSTVTAAVVGMVLNLAVWLGIHLLVPVGHEFDLFVIAVSAIAFAGMVKWKWDVIPVVSGAGVSGLIIEGSVPNETNTFSYRDRFDLCRAAVSQCCRASP